PVYSDGNDVIFGDLGNDWLVGGTGRDHVYGGWGDDLIDVDYDHTRDADGSALGANDTPDTSSSYEDIVYGGAGRDIMIGNTGGDRLIDWVGEFNSYIVPFAPFGAFTISRALAPQIQEYLYDLSASDGADPTRAADTGDYNADRNGEPWGELGLVMQKDDAWQDQTGAPNDPQPGNIPGGRRDVLRSADFNGNGGGKDAQGFAADSGVWTVEGGAFAVSPESLGGDAVSVFYIGDALPSYFEMKATIVGGKPTAGLKSNAYLIFDYQSPTDFKFAGVNISTDKFEMGIRTADGWIVLEQTPVQAKPDTPYNLLLAINGLTATLVIDGQEYFTHVFDARVDQYGVTHGLNSGYVGIGAQNSLTKLDNIAVQVLPPEFTLDETEDFSDGIADRFATDAAWQIDAGALDAQPGAGAPAIALSDLVIAETSVTRIAAQIETNGRAGFVFDSYTDGRYKYAVIDAANDRVSIGYYTQRDGFVETASYDIAIDGSQSNKLEITLARSTVSLALNGHEVLGHAFYAPVADGAVGLMAFDAASFDDVRLATNDPAYFTPDTGSLIYDYNSAGPIAIADQGVTTQSLFVGSDVVIADLDVTLSLTHERLSDLTVTLIAPDGTRIELFAALDGTAIDTRFDDAAGESITGATAPYGVTYRPVGDLAALEGKMSGGVWTLEIVDGAKRKTGTLESWSLTIEAAQALHAASVAETPEGAMLDEDLLAAARAQALQEIAQELGLTAEEIAKLEAVQISIASLDGTLLGYTAEGAITLDADGAGHGWSLDGSEGLNLVDALKHEFGHILGLADDSDAATWMDPTLAAQDATPAANPVPDTPNDTASDTATDAGPQDAATSDTTSAPSAAPITEPEPATTTPTRGNSGNTGKQSRNAKG
ncbi:proprotein convertase P-domain-containing protein, partial [Thioclava sp. UBA3469]|uniref:proprotein convertase P-domain-containing protein n=1 Tax=Thioclava sp. UBA3469 TaxID=1947693 RepID=UPI00257D966D